MINKESVRKISLILFSFIVFLLFILITLSLLSYFIEKNEEEKKFFTKNDYSQIPQEFDGKSIDSLISKLFGYSEYECSGTCHCDEDDRKISASIPLSKRGVVYLVTALTSLVAYDLAKKHFDQECHEKMTDLGCSSHSILSNVDNCDHVLSTTETKEDEEKSTSTTTTTEETEEKEDDRPIVEFKCSGSCLEIDPKVLFEPMAPEGQKWNKKILKGLIKDYQREQKKFRKENGVCRDLSTSGNLKFKGNPTERYVSVYWLFLNLEDFCTRNAHKKNVFLKTVEQKLEFMNVCNAYDLQYFDSFGKDRKNIQMQDMLETDWLVEKLNPTVKCVEVKIR